MPDTKITALTALTAADPANDVLPIVDVSDTTMAASGTTKKISINNVLGASGTATLASATISGDLTVDTSTLKVDSANNRVIVGHTTGSAPFQVTNAGGAGLEIQPTGVNSNPVLLSYNRGASSYGQLTLDASSIVHNLSGSTAMTLNSTGLGVGVSPLGRFHVRQSGAGIQDVGYLENAQAAAADVGPRLSLLGVGSVAMATVESGWNGAANTDAYLSFRTRGSGAVTERLRIDSSGNVGIGVTPSAKFDVGLAGAGTPRIQLTSASDNPIYQTQRYSGVGSDYRGERLITGGGFYFQSAPAAPIGSQTFTTRMTLDDSGRLILLASTTTPATLNNNGELTFTATSNTNLRFSYRGSDGVTRVANITLA